MTDSCDHKHAMTEPSGGLDIRYHEEWQGNKQHEGNVVCFLPTEYGVPEKLHQFWNGNGNRPYVVAAPEVVLEDPEMMMKVLGDLAKVAHAAEIQILLDTRTKYFSKEGPSRVRELGNNLSIRKGISTKVWSLQFDDRESVFDEIPEEFRVKLAALCMDSRVTKELSDFLSRQDEESAEKMRRVGLPWVPKRYARIRHFASILPWHPNALDVLPPEHREYILKTIAGIRAHTRWQFKSIGNHFSTNGAAGCAGIRYLRSRGMEIKDATHEIELIRELQDIYPDILGDAKIKFDVVSGTGEQIKVERMELGEFDYRKNGKLVGNENITI